MKVSGGKWVCRYRLRTASSEYNKSYNYSNPQVDLFDAFYF